MLLLATAGHFANCVTRGCRWPPGIHRTEQAASSSGALTDCGTLPCGRLPFVVITTFLLLDAAAPALHLRLELILQCSWRWGFGLPRAWGGASLGARLQRSTAAQNQEKADHRDAKGCARFYLGFFLSLLNLGAKLGLKIHRSRLSLLFLCFFWVHHACWHHEGLGRGRSSTFSPWGRSFTTFATFASLGAPFPTVVTSIWCWRRSSRHRRGSELGRDASDTGRLVLVFVGARDRGRGDHRGQECHGMRVLDRNSGRQNGLHPPKLVGIRAMKSRLGTRVGGDTAWLPGLAPLPSSADGGEGQTWQHRPAPGP